MNIDFNERLKEYQRNYYDSGKTLKWKYYFLHNTKIGKKAVKFGNVIVNKK